MLFSLFHLNIGIYPCFFPEKHIHLCVLFFNCREELVKLLCIALVSDKEGKINVLKTFFPSFRVTAWGRAGFQILPQFTSKTTVKIRSPLDSERRSARGACVSFTLRVKEGADDLKCTLIYSSTQFSGFCVLRDSAIHLRKYHPVRELIAVVLGLKWFYIEKKEGEVKH